MCWLAPGPGYSVPIPNEYDSVINPPRYLFFQSSAYGLTQHEKNVLLDQEEPDGTIAARPDLEDEVISFRPGRSSRDSLHGLKEIFHTYMSGLGDGLKENPFLLQKQTITAAPLEDPDGSGQGGITSVITLVGELNDNDLQLRMPEPDMLIGGGVLDGAGVSFDSSPAVVLVDQSLFELFKSLLVGLFKSPLFYLFLFILFVIVPYRLARDLSMFPLHQKWGRSKRRRKGRSRKRKRSTGQRIYSVSMPRRKG